MKSKDAIESSKYLKSVGITNEPDGESTLKMVTDDVTIRVEQNEGKKDWREIKDSKEAKAMQGKRALYFFNVFNVTSQRSNKSALLPSAALRYKANDEFQVTYKNGFANVLNVGTQVPA